MISIVLTGRNDNYGGHFEERLLDTVRHNTSGLEARGVPFEVVYVEWNPLPETAPLAERVAAEFPAARCFVVDPLAHRHLCGNRNIGVMEYHAKNVGARRARGDMILITNPDNYFGAGVLDLLAGSFDEDTLYRAARVDITDPSEVDAAHRTEAYAEDPAPFGWGAGDFTLCSRSLWERAGGYREDLRFTNTHKDAILVNALFDVTARAVKSGTTYHLVHGREAEASRRVAYVWQAADRTPQATYGHEDILVPRSVGERLTWLDLRPDLREDAQRREVPVPHTPTALRLPPRPFLKRSLKRLRELLRRKGLLSRRG